MFDRISRSWSLAGACWDILMEDPALLIFPLLSSLAIMVLLASFALPVWMVHHSLQSALADGSTTHTLRLLSYAATYAFYVITYAVVMFFNTALIAVALRRPDRDGDRRGRLDACHCDDAARIGRRECRAGRGNLP